MENKTIYGQLTEMEKIQLNNMRLKLLAIDSLFERLIREQEEFEQEKEKWYSKMRQKHSIPDDVSIVINTDNNIVKA